VLNSVRLAGLASEVARLRARFVIKDSDDSLKARRNRYNCMRGLHGSQIIGTVAERPEKLDVSSPKHISPARKALHLQACSEDKREGSEST